MQWSERSAEGEHYQFKKCMVMDNGAIFIGAASGKNYNLLLVHGESIE